MLFKRSLSKSYYISATKWTKSMFNKPLRRSRPCDRSRNGSSGIFFETTPININVLYHISGDNDIVCYVVRPSVWIDGQCSKLYTF
jgi:hypothetical protein